MSPQFHTIAIPLNDKEDWILFVKRDPEYHEVHIELKFINLTRTMLKYVATASAYSKALSLLQPSAIFSSSTFLPTSLISLTILISVRSWRGLNRLFQLMNTL
ncbi:102aa long hypothetical protein [Pyrococcus horikoshii OT3]|uniref:Uncharacterized protein n=1 Tax=Pyrococcus horikoshii (strain ATCC 700860 / DSM 12428 / JCM 9974 / NBRC 100139 / OT-3) TaxID=70601 RepID=O58628_PYRHO|nr:102aa long hypothetical protein [Pyrococcus horikoshii OT3]